MAVNYCTAADVANFLQVADFSGSTTPTTTDVESFINMSEQRVDEITDHAWHSSRAGTATTERGRIQLVNTNSVSYRGRLQLRHYPFLTLSTGSGDALSIWDGSKYTEYIANKTAGTLTDPLSGDYWTDTERGVVYFKSWPILYNSTAPSGIDAYVTYRYATTAAPDDIKQATIYFTASIIAANDDLNLMQEGADSMDNRTKAEVWENHAMKILKDGRRWTRAVPIARAIGGFGAR